MFQDLIDAKRILREIKLLRHLGRHDNIVEILDLMTAPANSEDFHTLYIVTMQYECDLERIISSNQRLTEQHAQYFVYQVLVRECCVFLSECRRAVDAVDMPPPHTHAARSTLYSLGKRPAP